MSGATLTGVAGLPLGALANVVGNLAAAVADAVNLNEHEAALRLDTRKLRLARHLVKRAHRAVKLAARHPVTDARHDLYRLEAARLWREASALVRADKSSVMLTGGDHG